jgi:hypothetical protein
LELSLAQPSGRDAAIERLWARARVDDLAEQMELEPRLADKIRAEILGLALEYNLVTAYTAFVAIDHVDAVSGGQPLVIRVAQPLPQGLQPGPFSPGVQPMAMLSASAPMTLHQATGGNQDFISLGRAFLAKFTDADKAEAAPNQAAGLIHEAPPAVTPANEKQDREAVLRWLARTQKLDGSWNDDIEWTAAALLAFVRAGYNTRSGIYRPALRRTVRYLVKYAGNVHAPGNLHGHSGVHNRSEDQASFLLAKALTELAEATGDAEDRASVQSIIAKLPSPSNALEAAALGQPLQTRLPSLVAIHSLDDLRLAALLRLDLRVPNELFQGENGNLARVWAAAL